MTTQEPSSLPQAPNGVASAPPADRTPAPQRPAQAGEDRASADAAAPGAPEPAVAAPQSGLCPVVGIGASAGGLEAFTELLAQLPLDTGLAFVLVQHLAPTPKSLLPELLATATRLPVVPIQDAMPVEPDHVYVVPSRSQAALLDGEVHLIPLNEAAGVTLPIDFFLRSLAADRGPQAIGVILSGTGSDGTLGLKAIKAEGGLTLAQAPATAKFDGMPRSAIAAGCVDTILPVREIAAELQRVARHPYLARHRPGAPETAEDLGPVFILLRSATGNDFSDYKHTTIRRRIARRMALHTLEHLRDYVKLLQTEPKEIEALHQDLLINVTSFFRDPEAFDALQRLVFPEILAHRQGDAPIRVWVPGCATGEEAYSIAIGVIETLEDRHLHVPVQIFATDLDADAIAQARAGLYSDGIAADLSPERLQRFFVTVDGRFQVGKRLREMCVFAIHNLTRDPPFSHLDLISCRNLLIYLGAALQKRILPAFHYGLRPGGFLFLGSSETIGDFADLFEATDRKAKIYRKKSATSRLPHAAASSTEGPAQPAGPLRRSDPAVRSSLRQVIDRTILDRYRLAAVVVDPQMRIVEFRGRTGPYLQPAEGEASLDLLKMARPELAMDLRAAVHRAVTEKRAARREGLRVGDDGGIRIVNLEAVPLDESLSQSACVLVLFEEVVPAAAERPAAGPDARATPEKDPQLVALEHELHSAKEYLQTTIEELETANEEMRSTNEELQSSNEELQSVNEEMDTTKEELQATNEELTTVNQELRMRGAELSQLSSELRDLLTSLHLPILIVGADLTLRRYTAEMAEVLTLGAAEHGRSLRELSGIFDGVDLAALAAQVMETGRVLEREVQTREGNWHALRFLPYRTADRGTDGAVLLLLDIDLLKQAAARIAAARDNAEGIVAAMPLPLLILDSRLCVVSASPAFYSQFRATPPETVGNLLHRLGNGQWAIPQLRAKLEQAVATGEGFSGFTVEHRFERIGQRIMSLTCRTIGVPPGQPPLLLLAIEDMTGRSAADAVPRALGRLLVDTASAPLGLLVWDAALRVQSCSPRAEAMLGWQAQEVIGRTLADLRPCLKDSVQDIERTLQTLCRGYERYARRAVPVRTNDGTMVRSVWHNYAIPADSGEAVLILSLIEDLSHIPPS